VSGAASSFGHGGAGHRARRMAPASANDVEQAAAGSDRGERLTAVLCGALVMATVTAALR
jgi:hypothetical protein